MCVDVMRTEQCHSLIGGNCGTSHVLLEGHHLHLVNKLDDFNSQAPIAIVSNNVLSQFNCLHCRHVTS